MIQDYSKSKKVVVLRFLNRVKFNSVVFALLKIFKSIVHLIADY